MQQLSFTIPYTSSAIRATIGALNQMDNDLNGTASLFAEGPLTAATHAAGEPVEFRDVPNTPAPINTGTPSFTPPPPVVETVEDEPKQPEGSVDANGMVWDERIHASTKTFVANGTWKLKKGVDKALVAQVTAELLGNEQAPAAVIPESVATTPTPSNVSTPPPPAGVIGEGTVPSPPADIPSVSTFRQLLSDIAKAGLAPDYVQNLCVEVNGCPLPQCRDDEAKLAMLRMSLGL